MHIVYVLADDIGWNDVGYQSTDLGAANLTNGGAPPTIDRLATTGVILDHFYTMSQCTPSRASLLSGRWPHRAGR